MRAMFVITVTVIAIGLAYFLVIGLLRSRGVVMKRFVRDNALSLFFLVTFPLAPVGQSIAGTADVNARRPGSPPIGYRRRRVREKNGRARGIPQASRHSPTFTGFVPLDRACGTSRGRGAIDRAGIAINDR